jgi:putative hydrolase of the HAD superfamily
MSKVRHVFFDLDRTLWDFRRNSAEALEELFEGFSLKSMGVESVEDFVSRYELHNEACWELYRQQRMHKNFLRHQRFFLALADFNIFDRQLAKNLGEAYVKISPEKPNLLPHAMELVTNLAEIFPLHIITNGFQEVQHRKLEVTGLKPYFQQIITSERANCKKPHAGIFKLAMKLSGAKVPDCLMIGDDPRADIQGAIGMGWKAIWYNERDFAPEGYPGLNNVPVTRDLRDVKAILQDWAEA